MYHRLVSGRIRDINGMFSDVILGEQLTEAKGKEDGGEEGR